MSKFRTILNILIVIFVSTATLAQSEGYDPDGSEYPEQLTHLDTTYCYGDIVKNDGTKFSEGVAEFLKYGQISDLCQYAADFYWDTEDRGHHESSMSLKERCTGSFNKAKKVLATKDQCHYIVAYTTRIFCGWGNTNNNQGPVGKVGIRMQECIDDYSGLVLDKDQSRNRRNFNYGLGGKVMCERCNDDDTGIFSRDGKYCYTVSFAVTNEPDCKKFDGDDNCPYCHETRVDNPERNPIENPDNPNSIRSQGCLPSFKNIGGIEGVSISFVDKNGKEGVWKSLVDKIPEVPMSLPTCLLFDINESKFDKFEDNPVATKARQITNTITKKFTGQTEPQDGLWTGNCGRGIFIYANAPGYDANLKSTIDKAYTAKFRGFDGFDDYFYDIYQSRTGCYNPEERYVHIPPYAKYKRDPLGRIRFYEPSSKRFNAGLISLAEAPWDEPMADTDSLSVDLIPNDRLLMHHPLCTKPYSIASYYDGDVKDIINDMKGFVEDLAEAVKDPKSLDFKIFPESFPRVRDSLGYPIVLPSVDPQINLVSFSTDQKTKEFEKRRVYDFGSLPSCFVNDVIDDMDSFCHQYVRHGFPELSGLSDPDKIANELVNTFKYRKAKYAFSVDNFCWDKLGVSDVKGFEYPSEKYVYPPDPYEQWMPPALKLRNPEEPRKITRNDIFGLPHTYVETNFMRPYLTEYSARQVVDLGEITEPTIGKQTNPITGVEEAVVIDGGKIEHKIYSLEEYGFRDVPRMRMDYAYDPFDIYQRFSSPPPATPEDSEGEEADEANEAGGVPVEGGEAGDAEEPETPPQTELSYEDFLNKYKQGRKEKYKQCLRLYIEQWAFEGDKGAIVLDGNYKLLRNIANTFVPDASMCQWVAYHDTSENDRFLSDGLTTNIIPRRREFRQIVSAFFNKLPESPDLLGNERLRLSASSTAEIGGINFANNLNNSLNTKDMFRRRGMNPEIFDYHNFLTMSAIRVSTENIDLPGALNNFRYGEITNNVKNLDGTLQVKISGIGSGSSGSSSGSSGSSSGSSGSSSGSSNNSVNKSLLSELYRTDENIASGGAGINFAARNCNTESPPHLWRDSIQPIFNTCDPDVGGRMIDSISQNLKESPLAILGPVLDKFEELLVDNLNTGHWMSTDINQNILSLVTPIPTLPVWAFGFNIMDAENPVYIAHGKVMDQEVSCGKAFDALKDVGSSELDFSPSNCQRFPPQNAEGEVVPPHTGPGYEVRDNTPRAGGKAYFPYHLFQRGAFQGTLYFKNAKMGVPVINSDALSRGEFRSKPWVEHIWPAATCMHMPSTLKMGDYLQESNYIKEPDDSSKLARLDCDTENEDGDRAELTYTCQDDLIYDAYKVFDDIRLDLIMIQKDNIQEALGLTHETNLNDALDNKVFGGFFTFDEKTSEAYTYKWLPNSWSLGVGMSKNFWCEFDLPYDPYHNGVDYEDFNNSSLISHFRVNAQSSLVEKTPLTVEEKPKLEYLKVARIRDTCGPFGVRSTWMEDQETGLPEFLFSSAFIDKDDPNSFGEQKKLVKGRCAEWNDIYGRKVSNPRHISWRLNRGNYEFLKSFLECTGPAIASHCPVSPCAVNQVSLRKNQKAAITEGIKASTNTLLAAFGITTEVECMFPQIKSLQDLGANCTNDGKISLPLNDIIDELSLGNIDLQIGENGALTVGGILGKNEIPGDLSIVNGQLVFPEGFLGDFDFGMNYPCFNSDDDSSTEDSEEQGGDIGNGDVDGDGNADGGNGSGGMFKKCRVDLGQLVGQNFNLPTNPPTSINVTEGAEGGAAFGGSINIPGMEGVSFTSEGGLTLPPLGDMFGGLEIDENGNLTIIDVDLPPWVNTSVNMICGAMEGLDLAQVLIAGAVELVPEFKDMVETYNESAELLSMGCSEDLDSASKIGDNLLRVFDYSSRGDTMYNWDQDDQDIKDLRGFDAPEKHSVSTRKWWLSPPGGRQFSADEPFGFWCRCPQDDPKSTRCREDMCTCEQHVLLLGRDFSSGIVGFISSVMGDIVSLLPGALGDMGDAFKDYPGIRPIAICNDYGPMRRWLQCYHQARAKSCSVFTREVSNEIPYSTIMENFTLDKKMKDNLPEVTQEGQSVNVCSADVPLGSASSEIEGFLRWSREEPNILPILPIFAENSGAYRRHEDFVFQSQVRDIEYPFMENAAPFHIDLVTRKMGGYENAQVEGKNILLPRNRDDQGALLGLSRKEGRILEVGDGDNTREVDTNMLGEIKQREGYGYDIEYFANPNGDNSDPGIDEYQYGDMAPGKFKSVLLKTRDVSKIEPVFASGAEDSDAYKNLYEKYIRGLYAIAFSNSHTARPEYPAPIDKTPAISGDNSYKRNVHPKAQDAVVGPYGCDVGGWYNLMLYQARCIRWFKLNCICDYDKTFARGNSVNYAYKRAGGEILVATPELIESMYQLEEVTDDFKESVILSSESEKDLSGKKTSPLLGKDKYKYNKDLSLKKVMLDEKGRPELIADVDLAQLKPTIRKSTRYLPLLDRGFIGNDFAFKSEEGVHRFSKNYTGPHNSKGLDNVMVGDIIMWSENIRYTGFAATNADGNAGGGGATPAPEGIDAGYRRHVAYVEEVARDSKNKGKPKFIVVTEMDNGKNEDSCSTTDGWGIRQTRRIYKPTCSSDGGNDCPYEKEKPPSIIGGIIPIPGLGSGGIGLSSGSITINIPEINIPGLGGISLSPGNIGIGDFRIKDGVITVPVPPLGTIRFNPDCTMSLDPWGLTIGQDGQATSITAQIPGLPGASITYGSTSSVILPDNLGSIGFDQQGNLGVTLPDFGDLTDLGVDDNGNINFGGGFSIDANNNIIIADPGVTLSPDGAIGINTPTIPTAIDGIGFGADGSFNLPWGISMGTNNTINFPEGITLDKDNKIGFNIPDFPDLSINGDEVSLVGDMLKLKSDGTVKLAVPALDQEYTFGPDGSISGVPDLDFLAIGNNGSFDLGDGLGMDSNNNITLPTGQKINSNGSITSPGLPATGIGYVNGDLHIPGVTIPGFENGIIDIDSLTATLNVPVNNGPDFNIHPDGTIEFPDTGESMIFEDDGSISFGNNNQYKYKGGEFTTPNGTKVGNGAVTLPGGTNISGGNINVPGLDNPLNFTPGGNKFTVGNITVGDGKIQIGQGSEAASIDQNGNIGFPGGATIGPNGDAVIPGLPEFGRDDDGNIDFFGQVKLGSGQIQIADKVTIKADGTVNIAGMPADKLKRKNNGAIEIPPGIKFGNGAIDFMGKFKIGKNNTLILNNGMKFNQDGFFIPGINFALKPIGNEIPLPGGAVIRDGKVFIPPNIEIGCGEIKIGDKLAIDKSGISIGGVGHIGIGYDGINIGDIIPGVGDSIVPFPGFGNGGGSLGDIPISIPGLSRIGTIHKYASCQNSDWAVCVEKYWDQVEIYRPYIFDANSTTSNATGDGSGGGFTLFNAIDDTEGEQAEVEVGIGDVGSNAGSGTPRELGLSANVRPIFDPEYMNENCYSTPVQKAKPLDIDHLDEIAQQLPNYSDLTNGGSYFGFTLGKVDLTKARNHILSEVRNGNISINDLFYGEEGFWKLLVSSPSKDLFAYDDIDEMFFNALNGSVDRCDPPAQFRRQQIKDVIKDYNNLCAIDNQWPGCEAFSK